MARYRPAQLALTLIFLAIIVTPGIVQFGIEAVRHESPQVLALFQAAPTGPNLRRYEKTLEDANWMARTLRPWMQFAQFHLLHDAGEKALFGRDNWFFYRPGVEYVTRRAPPFPEARGGVDPLPAIVAFRDQLAERGIKLLLLPMPNKESVYPDRLSGRATDGSSIICAPTKSLLDRVRSAGIEVVDMFGAFAEARRSTGGEQEPLYLAQDSHWSPAGVRRAARIVADRLLSLRWAQRGANEFPVTAVPLSRLGDVLRMLQSRPIERGMLPELMTCEQVLPGSGLPTQNNEQAQVLVLGDSFLRIYQNDEPGSAGFISHLAKELRQPISSIVSDGGASTLVRQELYRRPGLLKGKRVVIWEFVERDIRFGAEGWQVIPVPASR